MTVTTTALGTNTKQIAITNESVLATITTAVDAAITTLGWSQHDYRSNIDVVYKALNKDGVTYKYAQVQYDITRQSFSIRTYESWNATTHVGLNEAYNYDNSYQTQINFANSDIIIMASSRWLLIQSYVRNVSGPWFGVVETARDNPDDLDEIDVNWPNVTTLLHLDGDNTDTALGTTWTNSGASWDTSVKKFGTGSLAFSGLAQYCVCTQTTALNPGAGDFTVEAVVRVNAYPTSTYRAGIISCSVANAFTMHLNANDSTISIGPKGGTMVFTNAWTALTLGVLHHVAYSRTGTTGRFFIDGVLIGTSVTDSTTYAAPTASTTYIGSYDGGATSSLGAANAANYAWMDEVRLTMGYARYTAGFTPKATPFPDGIAAPCWVWVCCDGMSQPYLDTNTTVNAADTSCISFPRTRDGLVGVNACKRTALLTGSGRYGYGGTITADVAGAYASEYKKLNFITQAAITQYTWDKAKKLLHTLKAGFGLAGTTGRLFGLKASPYIGTLMQKVSIPVDTDSFYAPAGTATDHWILPSMTFVRGMGGNSLTNNAMGFGVLLNSFKPTSPTHLYYSLANGRSKNHYMLGDFIYYLSTGGQLLKYQISTQVNTGISAYGGVSTYQQSQKGLVFDGRYFYCRSSTTMYKVDTQNADAVTSLVLAQGHVYNELCIDGTYAYCPGAASTTPVVYKVQLSGMTLSATITAPSALTTSSSLYGICCDPSSGTVAAYACNSTTAADSRVLRIVTSTNTPTWHTATGAVAAGGPVVGGMWTGSTFLFMQGPVTTASPQYIIRMTPSGSVTTFQPNLAGNSNSVATPQASGPTSLHHLPGDVLLWGNVTGTVNQQTSCACSNSVNPTIINGGTSIGYSNLSGSYNIAGYNTACNLNSLEFKDNLFWYSTDQIVGLYGCPVYGKGTTDSPSFLIPK